MTNTDNLALPCIEGPEAQFHVTHNEALRLLDSIVQLSVLDRDLTAPPEAPTAGRRWIVAGSPTGAWSGRAGHVATWTDGAWQFSVPRAGWFAHVADEGTFVVFTGSAWTALSAALGALQDVPRLGLATAADATNPFSAYLNNALWAARAVADGGDGDIRTKLSKETVGDTASLLLQTAFSGRAEIGLAGDDDLHVKVSADGSAWREALTIDRASGRVSFPGGGVREVLTGDRTYHVRTDGSDANSGLADTAGGAFATIQRAVDAVAALDCGVFQATIQIADGTYTGQIALRAPLASLPPIIRGNAGTPANVIVDTAAVACMNDGGGTWVVRDLKITTSAGHAMHAVNGGSIYFSNIDFGDCAGYHLYAQAGGVLRALGSYRITGGAGIHAAANGWIIISGVTVTYANSPAFSVANFLVGRGGVLECFSMTFVNGGTVTGQRYIAVHCGVIFTSTGGSATYVPGNAAGTVVTGAQYD